MTAPFMSGSACCLETVNTEADAKILQDDLGEMHKWGMGTSFNPRKLHIL